MDFHLKQIQLNGFKNHTERRFHFEAGINCITGPNGVGKTNVLEAIHYLGFCKGYFNVMDAQNIQHGSDFFSIRGIFNKDGRETAVSCAVQRGQRKRMKRDDKEYERLADHIGQFPIVVISPYDVDLIREGSEARRRFMDLVISLDDKMYLQAVLRYNKALQHRNNLLKYFWENRCMDKEQLELWNERLIQEGTIIHEKRTQFFKVFAPMFRSFQSAISNGQDEADLVYHSKMNDQPLAKLLEDSQKEDLRRQHTRVGIHKDDLQMTVGGHPVKRFGSQGQQKSFLIALKLAQFRFIEEKTGVRPLLLLDDVFDKIDDQRVAYLVRLVDADTFGQIFITDTSQERLDRIMTGIHKSYHCIPLNQSEHVPAEE